MGSVGPRPSGTEAPTLAMLQEQYGDTYTLRRTRRLWVAARRDDHPDFAPTIIEESLARFVDQLRSPPPRAGRPFPAPLGAEEER